jgi:polysaccharide deacetylase family protein (PEP-CTERM system associated)
MRPQLLTEPRQHILTVVLEDYCHVGSVSRVVPPGYWDRFESRVQRNTTITLDLLDEVGAKATFFALGWIAERQPEVIAEVVRRGHEIATKGYFHRSIHDMSPEEMRDDAIRSREALEHAGGAPVRGYRIARGWFTADDLWALDMLSMAGFAYDSSIRPHGLAFHSQPHRRFIHRHMVGERPFWELPLSSWKVGPFSVPISGGNYVRQFPERFVRHAIAQWHQHVPAPLVFYFHIWELDPDQPRITAASPLQRIRQYRNLDKMPERIRHYLTNYRFTSVAEYLALPRTNVVKQPVAPAARVERPIIVDAPARKEAPTPRTPVTVVVPCYNEEATLGYLANTLRTFGEEVGGDYELSFVFVDDGSRDRTWERLNELFGNRADCKLVRHPQNRGVAGATLTGIAHAKTEIVCAIDCDSTYDPRQLGLMIPFLKPGVDLVTASPYHQEGRVLNLPAWRLVLSKGLSLLYRVVLHNKLATYTSCFRVYRRQAFNGLTLKDEGYVGITEMLIQLDSRGGRVVECPAVMEVRLLGHSKMKIIKTIAGHLGLLAQLVADRLRRLIFPKTPSEKGELP